MERDYMRPNIREACEFDLLLQKKKELRTQLHYVERLLEVDKKLHLTYAYLQGKIRKEHETTL